MLTQFSKWLLRQSSTRNTLIMAVLWLACGAGLMPLAQKYIEKAAGHPVEIIDLQVGKPASVIGELLESYGPAGRERYIRVQITADVVYPVVYTLFFGLLLSLVLRRFLPNLTRLNLLVLLPLAFDFLENICIILLNAAYPNPSPVLMQFCWVMTHLKFAMLLPIVGLILGGSIRGLVMRK